jgi:hypothetical protein
MQLVRRLTASYLNLRPNDSEGVKAISYQQLKNFNLWSVIFGLFSERMLVYACDVNITKLPVFSLKLCKTKFSFIVISYGTNFNRLGLLGQQNETGARLVELMGGGGAYSY